MSRSRSTQVRVRLPGDQARRWNTLPPEVRHQAVAVVLAAQATKIDLGALAEAADALTKLHLALDGLQSLALAEGFASVADQIEVRLARLAQFDFLLGNAQEGCKGGAGTASPLPRLRAGDSPESHGRIPCEATDPSVAHPTPRRSKTPNQEAA